MGVSGIIANTTLLFIMRTILLGLRGHLNERECSQEDLYATHRNGLSPHAVAARRFAHTVHKMEVQAVSRRLK